ncbi:hypothetical protein CABS01_13659 [Colletotrichum abscissum]|uniref:Uncharacterized protein n=3 Tax=Colletotrichum acutatum species complex TaxID=2707335 RepID=A0A9Q8SYP7_9PEZI|nr:uncharacterized protein CLUP02_11477 [Colletotrichum lupini]XP_060305683.1 uncharacterized protein CCOS01_15790 [Colletotrichum costaricense]XP_060373260.1 uncharacterized protein CTAM01_16176 [Colletotrichum tamarilloi]XP_060394591.1 uncharacterized protein CABS01_13659 [Colletotrichum abscissum]KAI3550658.1 hypothetical protein CSPX01_01708 [Colletotrichum filicis]KAK1473222.1 hypothetical protein CTAM01_16176 [Colletotrichum tamarilloi]KAK1484902.1 hypothetical protein CABS01_13659 [Col
MTPVVSIVTLHHPQQHSRRPRSHTLPVLPLPQTQSSTPTTLGGSLARAPIRSTPQSLQSPTKRAKEGIPFATGPEYRRSRQLGRL